MNTEYKYDVFISYSRKDYVDENKNVIPGNPISAIKDAFDKNSITYWFDEEGNLTGKKFAHIIAGKIRESMVFLFVCSTNSVASRWVDRELGVADALEKHIIPFTIDDSYKDDKVIMFTASLDRVEYYSNPQKELDKLIKAIQKDKDEWEENKKWEEERRKKEQQEEEERKRKLEIEKKRAQAKADIKQLALNYKLHSTQQEVILEQLIEKNLFIENYTKECPICMKTSAIAAPFCGKCGFQFPPLYGISGSDSYAVDEHLLTIFKTHHDSIEVFENEISQLKHSNSELKASLCKITKERDKFKESIDELEKQNQEKQYICYADIIIDGEFCHVWEKENNDTTFILTLKSESKASFTLYGRAYNKVLVNPSFLEGCEKQILGNTYVLIVSEGEAELGINGKWKVVSPLKVELR